MGCIDKTVTVINIENMGELDVKKIARRAAVRAPAHGSMRPPLGRTGCVSLAKGAAKVVVLFFLNLTYVFLDIKLRLSVRKTWRNGGGAHRNIESSILWHHAGANFGAASGRCRRSVDR